MLGLPPRSDAVIPVSARMVGDNADKTCRSMYPSRVHSIIVVGATHMRHPGAYGLIEAPVSLAWAPQIL